MDEQPLDHYMRTSRQAAILPAHLDRVEIRTHSGVTLYDQGRALYTAAIDPATQFLYPTEHAPDLTWQHTARLAAFFDQGRRPGGPITSALAGAHQAVADRPLPIMDGASTHILLHRESLRHPAVTLSEPHIPLAVSYPNGTICRSEASGTLTSNEVVVPVSFMPTACLHQELIGQAPFTQCGCTAQYTNTDSTFNRADGAAVLMGQKAPTGNLWHTDLADLRPHAPPRTTRGPPVVAAFMALAAATIVGSSALARRYRTVQERVNYLQLLFGDRPTSTMVRMLNHGWIRADEGWPVTADSSRQYSTHAINIPSINVGHLNELRHGIRSTKPVAFPPPRSTPSPTPDADEPCPPDTCDIKLVERLGWHADQKGPYKQPSYQGHTHDMVAVYNGFVIAVPCKGSSGAAQIAAFREIREYFNEHSVHPPAAYVRVDAMASHQVRQWFTKHETNPKMRLQYVQPGCHRANHAEKAIQDWERAQLSAMARIGAGFPLAYWNELRPRLMVTLNHTRPSTPDPSISAWHWLHGERYDFTAHPLVPNAALISRQVDADKRGSNGDKSCLAYALGPAWDHWRSQRILVKESDGNWGIQYEQQFDLHVHDHIKLPLIGPVEELVLAVQDLTGALNRADITTIRAAEGAEVLAPLGQTLLQAAQAASDRLLFVQPDLPFGQSLAPALVSPHPASVAGGGAEQRVVVPVPPQRVAVSDPAPKTESLAAPPRPRPRLAPVVSQYHTRSKPLFSPRANLAQQGLVSWDASTQQAVLQSTPQVLQPPTPRGALFASALIGMAAASTIAGCQRLAPKTPPPVPDPATLADPSFLAKILEGAPLTLQETAAWHAWVARKNADRPLFEEELVIPCALPASANHVLNLNEDGTPITWATVIKGPHGKEWLASLGVEFDRLFDLHCWHAIFRRDLPPGTIPTYLSKAVREKIKTPDPPAAPYLQRRVRGALGGDRVNSEGATRCNTAEAEVLRSLFNSIASDGADYFTFDVNDFYLGTPLPKGQEAYVKVPVSLFTDEILDRRDLRQYIHDGHILLCATQAMYGLRNAGRLSKEYLDRVLAARGYFEDALVPCIYRHTSNGVIFCLVVDDFAVKL